MTKREREELMGKIFSTNFPRTFNMNLDPNRNDGWQYLEYDPDSGQSYPEWQDPKLQTKLDNCELLVDELDAIFERCGV